MQKEQLSPQSLITLNSGNRIPIIGYGTYQLKGDHCIAGVQSALKCGYTHIDTASIYKNQAEILKAIQQAVIPREKLYITSKISPAEQGSKESREAVLGILKRLGLEYLDLVLIHWPGTQKYKAGDKENQRLRLDTWKSLIQLKNEKKVKDIGVSNFLTHHLQHLLKNSDHIPAVNQFQIHPLLWEGSTIKLCREHKIAIEAYSPLARNDDALFKDQMVISIADKHKKTVAQVSLRWCLQNGFIVLPKSKTESRIKENIDIFDFQLTQEEMAQIAKLTQKSIRTCWNPNNVKF